MIPTTANPAVFQYQFEPLEESWRHEQDDGGFRLTLYRSALVSLESLTRRQTVRETKQFPMGGQLVEQYLSLLREGKDWLFSVPGVLRLPQGKQPRFISRIGFAGYPYLEIYDIAHCSHLPFMDPTGRAARRITSLLEDVSELLSQYQIWLDPTDLNWNARVLTPLPVSQMNDDWRSTVS